MSHQKKICDGCKLEAEANNLHNSFPRLFWILWEFKHLNQVHI